MIIKESYGSNKVYGEVHSDKGFYVGDICYAMDPDKYHKVWGDKYRYEDGVFEDPETGYKFAIAGTAYGDGTYEDQFGREYSVDAGVIGILPLELAARPAGGLGQIFTNPGTASLVAEDGYFEIKVPGEELILINTGDMYDEEEEEDYNEYFDDEEEYDEDLEESKLYEDFSGDPNIKDYSTSQAIVLDKLSYLLSTEYEAVKWYDEAIPEIQASNESIDLIESTIQGIKEIRKDEEDHIKHIERLINQIKEGKLIPGTNGD